MKKTILVVVGIVVLVALIGGAAFVGGRLLNGASAPASDGGGLVMQTKNGSGGQQMYKVNTTPAKELPQEQAALKGIFVLRKDSSVTVGTGQVQMMATKNADGTVSMSTKHDGPDVEIVLTHDTQIWRDVTMKQFDGVPPASTTTLQQVVEPGSVDEIGENSTLVVWGERRGDRVTATTIAYTLPPVLNKGLGIGK